MYAFINAHRGEYGVEPICRVVQVAWLSYYAHKQGKTDPSQRSARRQRDEALAARIATVHAANYEAHGVRKI